MAGTYTIGDCSYELTEDNQIVNPQGRGGEPAFKHEEYTPEGLHVVTGWREGEDVPYVAVDNSQPPITP